MCPKKAELLFSIANQWFIYEPNRFEQGGITRLHTSIQAILSV